MEKIKRPFRLETLRRRARKTKPKNKLIRLRSLIERIVFFFLSGFDRLLPRFINDIIIRFAFFITAQRLKFESKLNPSDEREVRHE